MEEQKKEVTEGCRCQNGRCGCDRQSCGCASKVLGKVFAGIVLFLLGGIIGFLMGHGCRYRSMGMMSCPYTTMPTK